MAENRVIVALDYDNEAACLDFVKKVSPSLCRLKIGKEMFTAFGPALVEKLTDRGFEIFLDLKYHDIPNTVKKAILKAVKLGVWMVNVHCLGGRSMLMSAREAIAGMQNPPLLIGVTVLTSMDSAELQSIGFECTPQELVTRLAILAHECQLDGVVCSAQEAGLIKNATGSDFLCVTPGIRISLDTKDDQKRIMTPIEAIRNGADYLVIGRPITKAHDPLLVLNEINTSIGG